MKIRSVRGTHDILPGSVELWQKIEETARRIFRLYGYGEIRTPIFEETELFARSIGAETDIVQKEMYTFADSRNRQITLRPEGTAPVVRAFIQHGLFHHNLTSKLFYIGPMFRHERPQKGRYRQFHQIGAEVLGSDHPAVEAEVIQMLHRFLGELELNDFRLLVNSVGCSNCRPAYVELLARELRKKAGQLCPECRQRTESNTLRVLDCKVPACQPVIQKLPSILDHLCAECSQHFERFCALLRQDGIDYSIEPRLVRGLDYYVRTTFEFISEGLGPTQNALLGGGRYDGLSELLGGPPLKGIGFAMGMERFVLLLSGREELDEGFRLPAPEVFLAWLGEAAFERALELARQLRMAGVEAQLDFEGRSLKAQMKLANRLQARYVCIVGEEELLSSRYPLRNMQDGSQEEVTQSELIERLAPGA